MIEAMDGTEPDCRTNKGCLIPPLGPDGLRALEIRGKLIMLKELGVADGILRLYKADVKDLELMSIIEEELKELGDARDNE